MDSNELIQKSILHDMSEGVMTIGFDGAIRTVNPAACRILDVQEMDLLNKPFAASFFTYGENDSFNQAILDAVYDASATHENVVDYYTGTHTKQLHITTSYLRDGERKIGIIAVLGDISELMELRDAVKAMERIKKLNTQLELRNQLISETFGRYLSDDIVKSLLDTPDGLALGGKKRTLTVLMSDLRGFTAMSEQMPAQSLLEMLNHYLGEMTQIIQNRNGIIIEFIGDGIMAIFGAPIGGTASIGGAESIEGNAPEANNTVHASDAVVCAVEMQAAMEAINIWDKERGYPTLQMGIGVNTGEMIVGNIGSEKRTKYGVVGQQVNLCGRIESYTVGGQVLISPRTRELIKAPLEVAQELVIYPKGVKTALTISHVTAVGAPYHVCCGEGGQPPQPLRIPITVDFYVIKEKHCDEEAKAGKLTALSQDTALLETESPLERFDNLKLEIEPGETFGKVLRQDDTGYYMRFTSQPEGFEAWCIKQIQR